VAGVKSAGGIRRTGTGRPIQAPQSGVPRGAATPGAIRVFDPTVQLEANATVVGDGLAAQLGLRSGGPLAFTDDLRVRRIGIGDFSVRLPLFSRWAIDLVAPVGDVDSCLIEFEPGAFDAGLTVLPAMLGDTQSQLDVARLAGSGRFTRSFAEEVGRRTTRLGWMVGGLLITMAAGIRAWTRKPEIGLYLATGGSRATVLFMHQVELFVVVTLAALSVVGWTLALNAASHPLSLPEVSFALRGPLLAYALALGTGWLGTLAVSRGSVAGMLRDR